MVLQLPEAQVVALVSQLSPWARAAVLNVLLPELDERNGFADYGEDGDDLDLIDAREFLGYPEMDLGMSRRLLLVAETFHHSYANYDNHLGIGNIRFDELMPTDVDILERAQQEEWDDACLGPGT